MMPVRPSCTAQTTGGAALSILDSISDPPVAMGRAYRNRRGEPQARRGVGGNAGEDTTGILRGPCDRHLRNIISAAVNDRTPVGGSCVKSSSIRSIGGFCG